MAFTLHIFESEVKEIERFVSKYPNIETGGDLFGLWKANGDPVVQLLIGPGQNCRRTSVSFHQDTNYLARVGTYVNSKFMLCHIGSWHSHHQLSLTQPSAGDRSTVCNNFPEGLKRYIMVIANITRGMSVVIHPYMFSSGGHVCQSGSVQKISLGSPFREIGYVMLCIANGAEQCVSAEDAYLSRAPTEYHNRPSTRSPTEYHNRPSTRSKPITGAMGKLTNSESRSVAPNYPMHQNYLSTNGTIHPSRKKQGRYDPSQSQIDGYNDGNYHHKTKSSNAMSNAMNGAMQWYETEKGGTLLKKINEEITTTMTKHINYYRDPSSKDLTMDFFHNGKKWIISFPKSFDNEPAQISNSSSVKIVSSKCVTKEIRKACGCHQCHEHVGLEPSHPSPPKQDDSHPKQSPPPSPPTRNSSPPSKHVRQTYSRHSRHSPPDKRPQSRAGLKSPSQPWYNTYPRKAIVDEVKASIENYLKASNQVGRVRTMETLNSQNKQVKQFIFYHNLHDWIIEFASSSNKVELKIDESGQTKLVAELSEPYDVVAALTQNCPCTKCRSKRSPSAVVQRRQGSANLRRPNSRYGANIERRPPRRVSSTPKYFSSEQGEVKFGKICTEITTVLLNGRGNLDIQRNLYSKNIDVTFRHNRKQWKVTFPFEFPKLLPKVHHGSRAVPLGDGNVLRAIKKNCDCSSCGWYR